MACNKCIPVCPNNANFALPIPSVPQLPLAEAHQIANFADFCNDCGNCDVICPEDGGPYQLKPRLFVNRERWLADAPRDAILVEPDAITGRFSGEEVRLEAWMRLGDDPRLQALCSLRQALLAPGAVNAVNEVLRGDASA
jgi:putative selenate reductase